MEDAVKSRRVIIFFLWKKVVKTSEIIQRLQGVFSECAEFKIILYGWLINGRT